MVFLSRVQGWPRSHAQRGGAGSALDFAVAVQFVRQGQQVQARAFEAAQVQVAIQQGVLLNHGQQLNTVAATGGQHHVANAAAVHWREDDEAFFKLLNLVAERIAYSATLVDYWRTVDRGDEEIRHARQQMWLVFEEPMKRAVAKGLCKQTLNAKDLSLVFGMLGGALRGETPAQRKQLARRALQIILDGIKA